MSGYHLSSQDRSIKLLMVAGDVSGDRQGAHLARALRARCGGVSLYGAGGERMQAAGVAVRLQTTHLSSVGLQESLRYLWPLRCAMTRIQGLVRSERPDLAVLIDNEGFNSALSHVLANEGIPVVFYFPPPIWFWGEWRASAIAKKAKLIITEFPNEAELYRRYGGQAVWFGHPLLDFVTPESDDREIFYSLGLDPARPAMAVLPGSRFQELERLASPLLGAARLVKKRHPDLQLVIPLAAPHLRPLLDKQIDRAGMTREVTLVTDHVYTCLSRCSVALMSSGTATLEAALLGVPMVVAYRVSALTYCVGRCVVNTRFIARPNILLNDRVVPEFIQGDVTAERLAAEVLGILENRDLAMAMRNRLLTIRPLLGNEGAIDRAASAILREVGVKETGAVAELAVWNPSPA
jgi:lipid-A-disaccharide synthase